MKSIDDSINIIFVSALDALQELLSIFPDVNLDNIIRKPLTREEFLNKVKTAIGQRQRANVKLNNNNRTKTRSHSKLNNNVI
jgi:response regulator RpfG family c-di-GMP phosphodiesterase